MENTIEDALEIGTDLDWTVSSPGVGLYRAYCTPYVVTIEARNPKEDNTWTISFKDEHSGDEAALGPIETVKIGPELKAFIEEQI